MPLTSAGLSSLPPDECLDLLRSETIGRVVLSIGALPAALPVNYQVIDDNVVFRSSPGGKLTAALNHNIVAFEIDYIDTANSRGWSVLVVGKARAVTDPDELAQLEQANIQTWMAEPLTNYVAIRIDRISGRRLHPADPKSQQNPAIGRSQINAPKTS